MKHLPADIVFQLNKAWLETRDHTSINLIKDIIQQQKKKLLTLLTDKAVKRGLAVEQQTNFHVDHLEHQIVLAVNLHASLSFIIYIYKDGVVTYSKEFSCSYSSFDLTWFDRILDIVLVASIDAMIAALK